MFLPGPVREVDGAMEQVVRKGVVGARPTITVYQRVLAWVPRKIKRRRRQKLNKRAELIISPLSMLGPCRIRGRIRQ